MLHLTRQRKAGVCAAGLALVVAVAVLLFIHLQRLQQQPQLGVASAVALSRLENLHARCVKDMIASTCKVMGTATSASAVSPAKPGEQVFIAGVGAIAAVDYQQMYEAGDAMCSVVRQACATNWQSSRCQTAQKLLGS